MEGLLTEQEYWRQLSIYESALDSSISRWALEKRFQIALQRKLERLIPSIVPAEQASVQIYHQIGEASQYTVCVSVQVALQDSFSHLARTDAILVEKLLLRNIRSLDRANMYIVDTQGHAYRIPEKDEF